MPDPVPQEQQKVWVCDGCSSWTDRPVTYEALLTEWGWKEWEEVEDDVGVFCPECQ